MLEFCSSMIIIFYFISLMAWWLYYQRHYFFTISQQTLNTAHWWTVKHGWWRESLRIRQPIRYFWTETRRWIAFHLKPEALINIKAIWNCIKAITEGFVTWHLFACQHSLHRYDLTTHWLSPIIKMSVFSSSIFTYICYTNMLTYQDLKNWYHLQTCQKYFMTKSCIFWFKFPTYLFWCCKSAFAHMKT